MRRSLQLKVHGKGNAWPVPLGGTHPFYDRTNPRELSNAAFSLEITEGEKLSGSILVDAGHGTIQSLISGSNRIPDCICLTHGHMDHTLSVDWIVQSYRRKHDKKCRYPIYSTQLVCEFFIQSYPHLRDQVEFMNLNYGVPVQLNHNIPVTLTAFPVFHGAGASGASMLLFESCGQRILFTGDLLTPLLRKEDYKVLNDIDILVADTNNRFPWPGTNHWSFAGDPGNPVTRTEILENFCNGLTLDQLRQPHLKSLVIPANQSYFNQVEQEWNVADQPMTILEFLRIIEPRSVFPVHYSGAEDQKYHSQAILSQDEMSDWIITETRKVGLNTKFVFPNVGQVLEI